MLSMQFGPPEGYYDQDPGAPKSGGGKEPREHLEDLEEKRGMATGEGVHATLIGTPYGAHHLTLHHEGDGTSHLIWNRHERNHDWAPGEIINIKSAQKGDGAAMHDTARAIAADNPEIAFPKHSDTRTAEGDEWAQKEQRRHGEAVWRASRQFDPVTGTDTAHRAA